MKTQALALTLALFTNIASSAYGQDNIIEKLDYSSLNPSVDTLLTQIGKKRIVALGEGTHGTKEFNEIRTLVTKKLIKEKGFNYILFESSFGGALSLDKQLQEDTVDLPSAMKQNLISIWQTTEIHDLLQWVGSFNKQGISEVNIGGIDYAELSPTLLHIKNLLAGNEFPDKEKFLNELQTYVDYQDKVWNDMGKTKFKFDRRKWMSNGLNAYRLINDLETRILKDVNENRELKTALLNLKLGFETIHSYKTQKKDALRDSCMAEMVKSILVQDPRAKVVIWAHNVHIANKTVYGGNNGGGMGGYLRKTFPDDYVSVATITSTGTYSGTTESIPTRFNKFSPVKLEEPIPGSLEQMLNRGNRVIFTKTDNSIPEKIKMRFIGFGTDSGSNTFTVTEPKLLYDAIIYLGKTNASEHF